MSTTSTLRWLPWIFAGVGVLITSIFVICEISGHSLGRFVPLEAVMGVGELAAWHLIIGDNAHSRAEMYVWAFPFASVWNGFLGWLLGFCIRRLFLSQHRVNR